MSEGCHSEGDFRNDMVIITPPDDGSSAGELIKFIDESGSSSCASSLTGGRHLLDDTASLSHLLDEVGSGQFSIDALDDFSNSIGYSSSLDATTRSSDLGKSDSKLLTTPVSRKNCKLNKSDNILIDEDENANKSLERHRKFLKPCGEFLMRRSLGSEMAYNLPNTQPMEPSISMPGSTHVSLDPDCVNNNKVDLNSTKSSYNSYHTSQSSIKSSDVLDDWETSSKKRAVLFEDDDSYKCLSPRLPPQCAPPPIPLGESSYATSSCSSLVSSSSIPNKGNIINENNSLCKITLNNFSNSLDKISDPNEGSDNTETKEDIIVDDEFLREKITATKNVINNSHTLLMVPLAEMDEFSETKDDHTFDTLESKSDKEEKKEECCVLENGNLHSDNDEIDSKVVAIDVDKEELDTDKGALVETNTTVLKDKQAPLDSPVAREEPKFDYALKYGEIQEEVVIETDQIVSELKSEEKSLSSSVILEDECYPITATIEDQVVTKENFRKRETNNNTSACQQDSATEPNSIITTVQNSCIEYENEHELPSSDDSKINTKRNEEHTPRQMSGSSGGADGKCEQKTACATPTISVSQIHFPQVSIYGFI